MTPMPLLPARPSSTPSTALGIDTDAGSAGATAEGRTFAALLAAGVGSPEGGQPAGSVTSNGIVAEAGAKHPAQHRRPLKSAADPAAVALPSPAVSVPGVLPPQQPALPAQHAGDAAQPEPVSADTGKLDPKAGVRPGPISAEPGAAGPGAAASGTLLDDAASGDRTGRPDLLTSASAAQPSADFGKLIGQFGKPAGTQTTMDGQPIGSAALGASGGSASHADSNPPLGTAGSPAAAQPASSPQRLDGVALDSAQIRAAKRAPGEHAAGRTSSGSTPSAPSAHTGPATGTTLPPATLIPTPPASTHHTGAPAMPAPPTPATPAARAPEQPTPPPLHRQVAGTLLELRARGDGTHRVLLELHPADLGQVTVEVRMHAGTVSIDLGSANPDARHSLAKALPQLRAELADAGLGSASVSVGADTSGGTAARRDGDARPPRAVLSGSAADASLGRPDSISSDSPAARIRTASRLTGVDRWL